MFYLSILSGIINLLSSNSASNFGTLLSGCGAIALIILGIFTFIYGASSIERWKKEKRADKKSDIANSALDIFDDSELETEQWKLKVFLIFKLSEENKDNGDKVQLSLRDNEFFLPNYVNKIPIILSKLNRGKNLALRLGDNSLNQAINKIGKLTKSLTSSLESFYRPETNMKVNGYKELCEIPEQIKKEYEVVRNKLLEYLLVNNNQDIK